MLKKALLTVLITLFLSVTSTSANAYGGKPKPKRTDYTVIQIEVDQLPHPWLQWLWKWF